MEIYTDGNPHLRRLYTILPHSVGMTLTYPWGKSMEIYTDGNPHLRRLIHNPPPFRRNDPYVSMGGNPWRYTQTAPNSCDDSYTIPLHSVGMTHTYPWMEKIYTDGNPHLRRLIHNPPPFRRNDPHVPMGGNPWRYTQTAPNSCDDSYTIPLHSVGMTHTYPWVKIRGDIHRRKTTSATAYTQSSHHSVGMTLTYPWWEIHGDTHRRKPTSATTHTQSSHHSVGMTLTYPWGETHICDGLYTILFHSVGMAHTYPWVEIHGDTLNLITQR